ncbi:MAG: hypothetical protein EHM13_01655 [Acidobacteria bacterium]|nr:MAG: hypothetical protein EHM13_01655 [Acidobacteriota bacterium]
MRKSLLVFVVLAVAGPVLAGTLAGVTMPDSITVGDRALSLNGMGVRSKMFVKVYVGGLYLDKKTGDAEVVVGSDSPKRLVLHFVRDVDRGQITDAFNQSLRDNARSYAAGLEKEVARFLEVLEPMKSGEQFAMTYLPGTGTTITVRASDKLTVPGHQFSQVVFSMFLGSKPPSADLKKGLLGGK